jgi:two-component system, NarL family, nitrate/nitrite response regulator NarL
MMRAFTAREEQVAALMVLGHTDKVIGRELGMSYRTSEAHVRHICAKLDVRTRLQAAVAIVRAEVRL